MKLSWLFILIVLYSCTEVKDQIRTSKYPVRVDQEVKADSTDKLFLIYAKDHFGYINENGEVVISVKYKDALNFTEGLAPARIDGTFGYINCKDEFQIKPLYDFASNFLKGIAIVYLDGSPGVINRKGEFIVLPKIYKNIESFNDGISIVESQGGLFGGVNTKGDLIIDTIYKEIKTFSYNRAIVTGINDPNDIRVRNQEIGVINTEGELVVSFGKFFRIEPYRDGYANVEIIRKEYDDYYGWTSEDGRIDTTGKVLNDTEYIVSEDGKYESGFALEVNEKWGLRDRGNNVVVDFKYDIIYKSGIVNDRIFYGKELEDDYSYIWGLLNGKGDTVCNAKFTEISYRGFVNDVMYAEQDSIYGYINRDGDFLWKNLLDQNKNAKLTFLNSSHMLRAYSHVGESAEDSLKEKYERIDYAKEIKNGFPKNKFSLVVDTSKHGVFAQRFHSYKTYIFNTTGDTVEIEVQDGSLNMNMQVKSENGKWKDIEYIPNSWCGNSYYKLSLLNNEYWELDIPIYDGLKEVEARLKLKIDDKYEGGKLISETVIYSNMFKCKINPGQLWNKQGYSPKGIMDPYID
jgi:hypothetical protein